jgi:hypothetical protein
VELTFTPTVICWDAPAASEPLVAEKVNQVEGDEIDQLSVPAPLFWTVYWPDAGEDAVNGPPWGPDVV